MIPLSFCDLELAPDRRELTMHGTPQFPFMAYDEYLDRYINQAVPWHWHEDLEIILVREGCMLAGCGDTHYVVENGDAIFINSNVLHTCKSADNERCRIESMVFRPELLCGFPQSAAEQRYLLPLMRCDELIAIPFSKATPWQKETLASISDAYHAAVASATAFELVVQARLLDCFAKMIAHLQPQIAQSRNIPDRDSLRIKDMLRYIHEHFPESLSVAMIAASVGVSESECFRCFKKVLATTPNDYLLQYRIRAAAGMLSATDSSITEICYAAGFNQPSYFSKAFKAALGCTPREYRSRRL